MQAFHSALRFSLLDLLCFEVHLGFKFRYSGLWRRVMLERVSKFRFLFTYVLWASLLILLWVIILTSILKI